MGQPERKREVERRQQTGIMAGRGRTGGRKGATDAVGNAVRCRLTTRRVLVVIYVTWRPLGRDGDDHDCVRGVRATVSETKTEMACPRTKGSTAEVSFTVTAAGQIL